MAVCDEVASVLNSTLQECCTGFERLYDKYGALEVINALGKSFGNMPSPPVIRKLVDFVRTRYPQSPRPIRTIGFFYNNINIGGVQRVFISQFSVFRKLGIRVVFFTGMTVGTNEFVLPDYVKMARVPIPNALAPDFREQLKTCIETIQAEKIDAFYSHDIYDVARMVWMPLIVKTVINVPYFQHFHTIFSKQILRGKLEAFSVQDDLLQFADLLISQSAINQLYFSASGIPSICIPNPCELPDVTVAPKEKAAAHTILFLSRIDTHKRPGDAVLIMENVVREIPDAKLLIVGGGKEADVALLQQKIAASPVADHIEYCGPTLDVASYYRKADVFLVTTSHEGFLITLLEAQTFGIPVVCYDMPYLEIIRHPDNGIITVPQEAPGEAAEAVVNVLTDPELYRLKSRNGIATAKYFAGFDFVEQWRKILADWQTVAAEQLPDLKNVGIMLDTIRQHIYWCGKSVAQELEKANAGTKKLKRTVSYRIGQALTWLPSRILKAIRYMKTHGFADTCCRIRQKLSK